MSKLWIFDTENDDRAYYMLVVVVVADDEDTALRMAFHHCKAQDDDAQYVDKLHLVKMFELSKHEKSGVVKYWVASG